MGQFKGDSGRPDGGVSGSGTRRTGVRRFNEIIRREYKNLLKINVIFFLCIFPSIALFFVGLFGIYEFGLTLSIITAYPVGGVFAASMYFITRMLSDQPIVFRNNFKNKVMEILRQAGLAGLLLALILYVQVFLFWLPLLADPNILGVIWITVGIVFFFMFSMILPYIFMHYAYFKLPTFKVIKDSTKLAFSDFKRSFSGTVLGFIPWIVLFITLPFSFLLFPLLVFSLSWLISLIWIWPVFDKHYSIEETLINNQRNIKPKPKPVSIPSQEEIVDVEFEEVPTSNDNGDDDDDGDDDGDDDDDGNDDDGDDDD